MTLVVGAVAAILDYNSLNPKKTNSDSAKSIESLNNLAETFSVVGRFDKDKVLDLSFSNSSELNLEIIEIMDCSSSASEDSSEKSLSLSTLDEQPTFINAQSKVKSIYAFTGSSGTQTYVHDAPINNHKAVLKFFEDISVDSIWAYECSLYLKDIGGNTKILSGVSLDLYKDNFTKELVLEINSLNAHVASTPE